MKIKIALEPFFFYHT